MRNDDAGVTLLELLVCFFIASIVSIALATSFLASTKSITQSALQMSNTHDSQMAATFFSSDVQSANKISTDPSCGQSPLVTFSWYSWETTGPTATPLPRIASYLVVDQGGDRQLIRQFCSGFGQSSSVVIAHNLNAGLPTVQCFVAQDPTPHNCAEANGPSSDVTFASAQITATAQATDADNTGFQYVVRATRRTTGTSGQTGTTPPTGTP